MKLSRYKTKHRVKELLLRISHSCQEDNIDKFEYALTEVFKVSFKNGFIGQFDTPVTHKFISYVKENLDKYKPLKISEKYLEEFNKLNEDFKTEIVG